MDVTIYGPKHGEETIEGVEWFDTDGGGFKNEIRFGEYVDGTRRQTDFRIGRALSVVEATE